MDDDNEEGTNIATTAIENLAIMLNLENEMIDHSFGHFNLTIN